VVRTDPATVSTGPLVRLFALYSAGLATALLVFGYVALGWLVVRPVDALSRAARRVSEGARSLEPPSTRTRELAELGVSLRTMTLRLRADEEALVAKIAEVERSAAELREAQARLVRSERLASVGRLSAGLAHELGNPLAAIVGLVDLLESGGLDEDEQRDFLARVRRETERMHGVLRGLLDFARPAAPRAHDEAVSGSVEDAVHEVRGLLAPQRDFRELTLELALDADLPSVRLSTSELTQVLLNLALNARDAVTSVARQERAEDGPRGEPEPASSGRVRVSARALEGEGLVELAVDDDGPGVEPALAATLFEPFVTTKEVGKGTGLGLAVCRGLVEAAGGTIEVRRSALGGACFVVRLPLADAPASAPPSRPTPAPATRDPR
jgi:two-component system NtrC family sensor kinase